MDQVRANKKKEKDVCIQVYIMNDNTSNKKDNNLNITQKAELLKLNNLLG